MKNYVSRVFLFAAATASVLVGPLSGFGDSRVISIDIDPAVEHVLHVDVSYTDILITRSPVEEMRAEAEIVITHDEQDAFRAEMASRRIKQILEESRLELQARRDGMHLGLYVPPQYEGPDRQYEGDPMIPISKSETLRVAISRDYVLKVRNESGDVSITGIEGGLNVLNSDGKVTIEQCGGEISIENRHGDIRIVETAHGADDSVTIEHEFGTISFQQIAGSLNIQSRYSVVEGEGVDGNCTIVGSHEPISVTTVAGLLTIRNEFGDVSIAGVEGGLNVLNSDGKVTVKRCGGEINIENNGDIRIVETVIMPNAW